MAVHFSWGGGWSKISFACETRDRVALLCCPGPSLAKVHSLQGPGRTVMAINTAYPHIRPDLWVGMDDPHCYKGSLWQESFPKFCRGNYWERTYNGVPLIQAPATYFVDLARGTAADIFNRRGHDVSFYWDWHTLGVAVHLLVWMGFKEIHFVGCDLGGSDDYYDDRKLATDKRDSNRRLYAAQVKWLKAVSQAAAAHGIKLVSATPDSPINAYMPYVPIAETLARVEHTIPDLPILHAIDAEARFKAEQAQQQETRIPDTEWNYAGTDNACGVVTACDSKQEWMLPWWWDSYHKHCALPVLFIDHGMTETARRWCEDRGRVIKSAVPGIPIISQKPFALLRSPFRRSLWMDLDCEVCADLQEVFDATPVGMIGVTLDPYNDGVKKSVPPHWKTVAAGVIVYDRDDSCITQWASLLTTGKYRDDQYALNALIPSRRFHILPGRYQRLRFDPESSELPVIRHWHGQPGKDHIKAVAAAEGLVMQ